MIYPAEIPETLQAAIFEWYQFREVADNIKTPVYINRILKRDYPRYNQILRVEAGVSEYDWLVQNYRERQTYNHEIGENSSTQNIEGSNSQDTTNGAGKTVTTRHTGTITDALQHGHVVDNTGTVGNIKNFTPGVTETKTDTTQNITSGGYADTTADGRIITDTRDTQTIGADDSTTERTGWNTTNQKQLQKNNPMSISYGSGVSEAVAGQNASGAGANSGGTLDWSAPSFQGANFGMDNDGEVIKNHQGHIQDENVHSTTGNLTNTRNYNNLKSENSGSITTTRLGIDNTTDTRTDALKTTNSGTDTTTKTLQNTDTVTTSGTDTIGIEGSHSQDTTNNGNIENERLTQEIYTGRNDDPAAILKRAVSYIMNTDAFEWLCTKLDKAFMGVYDL